MSDFDQPEVPVSAYGRQRREQWLAGLQANADMATAAAMAAHQADHDEITRSTHGIFGALSGEQLAANVAARAARVGDAWGQGRELTRQGGTFNPADVLCGPVPPQRDMRQAYAPGGHQPGQRPTLWDYMNRGRG